jgi:hypothetical protein
MATVTLLKKLLHSIPLGRKADPDLKAAVAADDLAAFQKAFLAVIAKPVKRLRKQLGKSSLLAGWSIDAVDLSGRERELAASLEDLASHGTKKTKTKGKGKEKKAKSSNSMSKYDEVIANWLIEVGAAPGPWESIAIAEILLREGQSLSPENFTQALAVVADAALHESSGGLFDSPTATEENNSIRQMIQQGETPWVCSLLLSPLGGTQTLAKSATESLRKVLLECADSEGLVHGSLLNRLPDWLAPLTRCSIWAEAFQEPLWKTESAERLTLVTERAALLLLPTPHHRADDAPSNVNPSLADILPHLIPLSGSTHEKQLKKLVKECRKPAGEVSRPRKMKKVKAEDDADEATATSAKSSKSESAANAKKSKKDANRKPIETEARAKPDVSWQSDSSCIAILRSGADADADTMTLEWHTSKLQIMVAAAGVPILAGNWNWSVQLDDEILPAPTGWKCSCWFLDPETVFVELEAETDESITIKQVRQLLLAPYDRFAMMTDSVTSLDPDRKVQLITSVPLVDGATCSPCDVTRELSLSAGPRTVRSFPLWLEDDRIQHALGSYREHDGQLEMAGVGKGGVTLPLALDWHPKRENLPADWSKLTVTENRRTVGGHEASSFRIRVGDHQVQVYRSLMTPTISRAVLGLHTWDESVYGRVPAKGGLLQPLVEVEYPE